MDARPHVLHPATGSGPAPVMQLLHDHLPLTLLVDLALGEDLHSDEVFAAETAELAWLVPGPR